MNQFFSLPRFGRLLRKHTTENLRSYLMGIAVLAGGVLIVLGTITYLSHRPLGPELQLVMYMFGLLSTGIMFTASIFAAVGNPRGAAPMLLLPASHFEKYLLAWLWSLPIFLTVYTGVFILIDYLVLKIGNQGLPYELYAFSGSAREWLTPLLSYGLLHSVVLWGAIYFKRLHIVKAAFLTFGLLAAIWIVNYQIMRIILPGSRATVPFGGAYIGENGQSVLVQLPDNHWQLVMVALPLALATLLWLAAYARLTEKQL